MNALRKREHFIRHNQVSDISYKKEDFPFIFTKKAERPEASSYKIQLTLYSSMICGGRGVCEEGVCGGGKEDVAA